MNPEAECIETEGTIISLLDYQPESEPEGAKMSFQPLAVEKIGLHYPSSSSA